jgi:formyltetrahydrofolate deformylase
MKYTILIECPDAKGLIHAITGVIHGNHANIISNHEFVEHNGSRFFMRTEIEGEVNKEKMKTELATVLPPDSSIFIAEKRKKGIVILVTREHHCLGELLVRNQFDELNASVLAVIGNHNDLENFTGQFSIPFHSISHDNKSREDHEKELLNAIKRYAPDYIILAKYMRILSPEFINHYPNRIINIHHSFLPAFIGGKPYRQAYERGVKIIGATAHFVNDNLDEGPIIVQQVIPTDHSHSAQEMSQMGRDVEKITLAKALKLVFDDRIFVNGNKTIIFD